MARMTGEARREAIVEAARRVLLAKGLAAATTRDVTAEAGVAAGLLRHYFAWADLRALAFARILRDDLDASLAARRTDPPAEVLADLIDGAFDAAEDPVWRLWIEASDLAPGDPAMVRAAAEATALWQAELAALFARGAAAGAWTCADPEGAAWRVVAALSGLTALALASQELTRAEATHHLRVTVGHECRPPGPGPAAA